MKKCLRFIPLLMVAVLFFSCASDSDEAAATAEETLPVVETVTEEAAVEVVTPPVAEEPVVAAEDAVAENADEDVSEEAPYEELPLEAVAEEEEIEGEAVPFEDEFVPVEETSYTLDVTAYYDDFLFSDDDFIAVELPEPAVEEQLMEEPFVEVELLAEEPLVELEPVAEEPLQEQVPEEAAPEMELIPVPPVREDMKKPVSVITEEEALAAAQKEHDNEDVSELEEIIAAIPEPEKPARPAPSRSVTIHRNDIIEVPYQGNWWVYLGDENSSATLVFSGREYVSEKTVFTLRAVKEGVALLHFFKQDIIADIMIDDYLEVIVEEATGLSEKTTLDMYIISQIKPEPVTDEESELPDVEVTEISVAPVISYMPVENEAEVIPSSTEVPSAPKAQQSILIEDEADVVSASVEVTDAELFERAKELEATDIEGALELYKQLVAEFPTSPYWVQANNRITYINRFYFFKR